MKLKELQSNPSLIKSVMKLWNDPNFQVVLGVLDSEHVMLEVDPSEGDPSKSLLRLGRIDGYNVAKKTIVKIFAEPTPEFYTPKDAYASPVSEPIRKPKSK